MKSLTEEVRIALKNAQKGNKDDAIRKRVAGEDDLSKKYLHQVKKSVSAICAPIFLCEELI